MILSFLNISKMSANKQEIFYGSYIIILKDIANDATSNQHFTKLV